MKTFFCYLIWKEVQNLSNEIESYHITEEMPNNELYQNELVNKDSKQITDKIIDYHLSKLCCFPYKLILPTGELIICHTYEDLEYEICKYVSYVDNIGYQLIKDDEFIRLFPIPKSG
jgi:hypothetical protein